MSDKTLKKSSGKKGENEESEAEPIQKLGSHTLPKPEKKLSVITWAIDTHIGSVSILWSNQTLEFYHCSNQYELIYGVNALSAEFKRNLKVFPSTQNVSSVALHSGLVAILGITTCPDTDSSAASDISETPTTTSAPTVVSVQASSSSTATSTTSVPRPLLMVWNSKYGVLQGKQYIQDFAGKIDVSDFPSTSSLSMVKNFSSSKLFCKVKDDCVICPIYCPSPTLATSLGSFSRTQSVLDPSDPLVKKSNWNSTQLNLVPLLSKKIPKKGEENPPFQARNQVVAPTQISDSEWTSLLKKEKRSNIELKFIEILTNNYNTNNKITNEKDFMKSFWHFANKASTVPVPTKTYPKAENCVISLNFGEQIAGQCLMWSYYNGGCIQFLLRAKAISTEAVPHLVPTLIQMNQMDSLIEVLVNVEDLSAEHIVRITQYFISEADRNALQKLFSTTKKVPSYKTKLSSTTMDDDNSDPSNSSNSINDDPLPQVLTLIVKRPVHRLFLLPWVKKLTGPEIVEIMDFLTKSFESHMATRRLQFKPPKVDRLIEWSMAVLDAHVHTVVLVDECNDVVMRLYNTVQQHLQLLKLLAPVQGWIEHMVNKGTLPDQTQSVVKGNTNYAVSKFDYQFRYKLASRPNTITTSAMHYDPSEKDKRSTRYPFHNRKRIKKRRMSLQQAEHRAKKAKLKRRRSTSSISGKQKE